MSNEDARLSSSECLKKSFETHSSVAVLYRNEVSVLYGHNVKWNHCFSCSDSAIGINLCIYSWTEVLWSIYLVHWTSVCNKQVPDYYDWNWNHSCYECRPEPHCVSAATVDTLKSDLRDEFCCRLSRWVPVLQLLISDLHPMGRTGSLPWEHPVPYGHKNLQWVTGFGGRQTVWKHPQLQHPGMLPLFHFICNDVKAFSVESCNWFDFIHVAYARWYLQLRGKPLTTRP